MPGNHCKVFFDLQGVEKLCILAEKKKGFFAEANETDNIIRTFSYLKLMHVFIHGAADK